MSDTTDPISDEPSGDPTKHDVLMTLFIAGIALLLLGCAVLMIVANNRPPAGL